MATSLKSIRYTKIYLGSSASWLSGVPGTNDPVPTPAEFETEVMQLRKLCEAQLDMHKREDFPLRHDDTGYRAAVIHSLEEVVFVLRRIGDTVPLLEELGIHPVLVTKLLKNGLTGLIVVSGAFDQGKTTTASSIVVSRLRVHGGVAVTAEDPPEMSLQGRYGEGMCFQTWVMKGGFADACRKATRWAPSMIYLGEIRDAETSVEAMRAAINGRLVICTTHAENPIMAMERIFSLATGAAGSSDDVANLMASGLACVMHQKLENHGDRKQLSVQSLWLDGEDAASIRTIITTRNFKMLTTAIEQQKNALLNARAGR